MNLIVKLSNAITNFPTVKTPALEQENNTHGKNDNVQGASTTTASGDDKDKQPPVQQAIPIVPKELAAQTPPVTLQQESVVSMFNFRMLSVGNGTSRALCVATSDAQQVVPRGGTVSAIEVLKNLPNNEILNIKFFPPNVQSVAQIFKKSDREVKFSFPNGNTYELDLHLINEESLKVLFNSAINNFSTFKTSALEQESNIQGNNQQPSGPVSNIQNDQSTSIIISNGIDNIQQEPTIVSKESEGFAAQITQDTSDGGGVTNGKIIPQPESVMPIVDSGESNQSYKSVRDLDQSVSKLSTANNVERSGYIFSIGGLFNQQQLKEKHAAEKEAVGKVQVSNAQGSSEHSSSPKQASSVQQEITIVLKESEKTAPDTSVEGDIKTNSVQSTNPGNGSTTAIQNTQKSKWPTVAIPTLAVAALTISAALVAHFVFQASLLATGITAGVVACFLVPAAIIYCCNRPSNSFKCI